MFLLLVVMTIQRMLRIMLMIPTWHGGLVGGEEDVVVLVDDDGDDEDKDDER